MKKIFTLLTLLLCAVTSVSAQTTYEYYYTTAGSGSTVNTSDYFSGTAMSSTYNSTMSVAFKNAENVDITSTNFAKLNSTGKVSFTVSANYTANVTIIALTKDQTSNNGIKLQKKSGTSYSDHAEGSNAPTTTFTTFTETFSDLAAGDYQIVKINKENAVVYVKVIETSTKIIATQTLNGVKVGGSALTQGAATNGYSVSGTTITLSDDITAVSAPDNVTLTKRITYTDSSTSDADVDVTFDGTVTSGYFIGTATIGLTSYTVRVKKDVTPTIELNETSGTISLTSYQPTGSKAVTLTGSNLTDGTYDVTADVAGTTISPTSFTVSSGTVDQEFTITSTASSAATTVFTFGTAGMGTAAPTYTLTYSKTAQRGLLQSTVDASTTWDWANAGDNTIQLDGTTSPTNAEEFIMANLAELNNNAFFNSQALEVKCQFPTRGSSHYFQGNSVKFTTANPGVVKVWFSNTSDRSDSPTNRRYLYINDTNTDVYTLNTTFTTAYMFVPAGEVVINAKTGDDAATMVRIQKIQFEEVSTSDADVEITSAGYRTFVLTKNAYFDATPAVTAYKALVEGDQITLTEVKAAPAGTPLVLKATAGTYDLKGTDEINPTAVTGNDLTAGPVTGTGADHYVLGKDSSDKLGFGLLASGVNLPATKAYIAASKFTGTARQFYEFDLDGDVTAIKNIKVGTEDNVYYDLNGRRVLYPKKGLYIVNGKKVIVK
ncbi:MAG: hypothetical protein K6G46_11865 [Prevotella sp.]|nr:hypothetical protein [Prevotella sp.]